MTTQDLSTEFLNDMQARQKAWSDKNFGQQPPYMPMFGIIEEIGELVQAHGSGSTEEVKDAIGDIVIYLIAYCNSRSWPVHALWDEAPKEKDIDIITEDFYLETIRALAHHQLKGEQKIRGTQAKHDLAIRYRLGYLLFALGHLAQAYGETLWPLVGKVFDKVSLRDWVANPNDANVVAEKEDIARVLASTGY